MSDTEQAIQAALNVAFAAVKIVFPPGDGPWPEVTVEYDDTAVRQAIRRAVLVGRIEEASSAVRYCEAIGVSKESELWLGLNMRLAELEAEAQA